jgi:predicted acetyltransferase
MILSEVMKSGALDRKKMALGFETMYGDGFALVGGMRSGGSPPGLLRRMYRIFDTEVYRETQDDKKADVGFVEIYTDANDDIRGLINIKITKNKNVNYRKQGIGNAVVKSLIDSCPTDFGVFDIQKVAIGFWKKMGAEFVNRNGEPLTNPQKQKAIIYGIIHKQPGSPTPMDKMPGFSTYRG